LDDKILVTGGTGFIGKHLVSKLVSRSNDIRVLALDSPDGCISTSVEYIRGNYHNESEVRAALRDIQVVYHLAATTIPGTSNDVIQYDAQTNLIGSLNLIQAAAEAGVKRFVFTSSGGSIYGITDSIPISEDHPINPITAHGVSKLAVEKYLEIYRHRFGMDYRIARGGNPFGEDQDPSRGQGFIAYALGKLAMGEEIVIWGNGDVVRDFFYVGDFADALCLLLDDQANYRVYNVGSGEGKSLNKMLVLIESVTGRKPDVRYEPSRLADVPYNCLNIQRIKDAMGWFPRTPILEGLERTWIWVRSFLSLKSGIKI
jgi:UDP-glucose 4-epimerase